MMKQHNEDRPTERKNTNLSSLPGRRPLRGVSALLFLWHVDGWTVPTTC